MQVFIDQSKMGLTPPAPKYKNNLKDYYHLDTPEPIEVFGILRFQKETPHSERTNMDYYLARMTKRKSAVANFGWARRTTRHGGHTWEVLNSIQGAKSLEDFENLERTIPFQWLPTFYTFPVANKYSKSVLVTMEEYK